MSQFSSFKLGLVSIISAGIGGTAVYYGLKQKKQPVVVPTPPKPEKPRLSVLEMQMLQLASKQPTVYRECQNLIFGLLSPKHSQIVKWGIPGVEDLKFREGFIVSYDRRMRNPRWVAEHLTESKLKTKDESITREKSQFQEDLSIPEPFQAKLSDYERSGFDRGHLVPARDVKYSQISMNQSFLLSNISPQVGEGFNRGYWARLEQFVRNLCKFYQDVYVISGPLYLPKQMNDKFYVKYQMIGNPPNVAVPTHFFKVLLATNDEKVFVRGAFLLPNTPIPDTTPLEDFLVPIERVEKESGLLFFKNVKEPDHLVLPLCIETKCELPPTNFWLLKEKKKEPTSKLQNEEMNQIRKLKEYLQMFTLE